MREVKIEEYWPLIVKRTEEFGQIAVAENPEFNELSRCVYQALKDSFLLPGEEEHAGEYAVSRWERMLGLGYTPDMSLDDRKAAILTYLSVKLPYTWRVLKQMLVGLLGEGNFEMSLDNETQKITIALSISTTQSQIDAVNALIERVVPQNLVIELEWADGLPMTYTRLEYLESTGQQYINTTFKPNKLSSLARWEVISTKTGQILGWYDGNMYRIENTYNSRGVGIYAKVRTTTYSYDRGPSDMPIGFVAEVEINADREYIRVNDNNYACPGLATGYSDEVVGTVALFRQGGIYSAVSYAQARVMLIRFWREGEELANFIPALDPTGCPCLFDTVTFEPYYNKGTGQFLYPTDAAPAVSADFDEKFYAKLTEHGVRRLYHVPKGYTGSKDQYAAEHGFKELVEPPMPLEGYWTPEWRETDTQLICEWVETEPPTEVTEND